MQGRTVRDDTGVRGTEGMNSDGNVQPKTVQHRISGLYRTGVRDDTYCDTEMKWTT